MFDDENDYNNTNTFTNHQTTPLGRSSVSRTVETETYTDLVDEFRWFLNSVGYTYIGGLVVLDEKGNEIYQTSM